MRFVDPAQRELLAKTKALFDATWSKAMKSPDERFVQFKHWYDVEGKIHATFPEAGKDDEIYEAKLQENAQIIILAANHRLIYYSAKRVGIPTERLTNEMFIEGISGMLLAINTFDPALGKFSTHAVNHVQNFLKRAAANASPTTGAVVSHDAQQKIRRVSAAIYTHGDNSPAKLAELTDLSEQEVRTCLPEIYGLAHHQESAIAPAYDGAQAQLLRLVLHEMAKLPEMQRAVLVAKCTGGDMPAGVPERTLRYHAQQGRAKIAEALEAKGVDVAHLFKD